MLWRLFSSSILLVLLLATGLRAQVLFGENFDSTLGFAAPPGWGVLSTGTNPAPWRFDNPGFRPFATPFSGKQAIVDSAVHGPFASGTSYLTTAPMNLQGRNLVHLSFDQQLRDNLSGRTIEVFDGQVWNTIYSHAQGGPANVNIGYLMPNVDTTVSTTYDITAAGGGATNARVRFGYAHGFDYWWALDNVKVEQPLFTDLEVLSIDSPTPQHFPCGMPGAAQVVRITVRNIGTRTLIIGNVFPTQLRVDGVLAQTTTLFVSKTLNPGDTLQYSFPAPITLAAPGPHTIGVNVAVTADVNPTNNTKVVTIPTGTPQAVLTLPYAENFDLTTVGSNVPPGFLNRDPANGGSAAWNWVMANGGTTLPNTGPSGDHTTGSGNYALVSDAASERAAIHLLSPCLDLTTVPNPVLNFWLHSHVDETLGLAFENHLSVDVIGHPGGLVTVDVFGPEGSDDSSTWAESTWQLQAVDLAPFSGQVVQLRFRARTDNASAAHDIAIDDVAVFNAPPLPGQASRVGKASFDINGATEVYGFTPSSYRPGPYSAGISQGGPMRMSFEGEANQAITVVYGPLSPNVASYPNNIGQFDIGTPVGPLGVPGSIQVFANAIGWAQGGFVGFPFDAFFFTTALGTCDLQFQVPNYGIPAGTVITTMQSAITSSAAPFVYMSNAVTIVVN